MSDTPRTDSMVTGNSDVTNDEYEELAQLARILERELTEAERISNQRSIGWDTALDVAADYLERAEKAKSALTVAIEERNDWYKQADESEEFAHEAWKQLEQAEHSAEMFKSDAAEFYADRKELLALLERARPMVAATRTVAYVYSTPRNENYKEVEVLDTLLDDIDAAVKKEIE